MIGNAATEQKNQNYLIDLVDDALDENNQRIYISRTTCLKYSLKKHKKSF